jgi:hypothetical protein
LAIGDLLGALRAAPQIVNRQSSMNRQSRESPVTNDSPSSDRKSSKIMIVDYSIASVPV